MDTLFETTISEDVKAVTNPIRESMKTKLALFFISRSYEIMVENSDGPKPYSVCFIKMQGRYIASWVVVCCRLQITIGEGQDEYHEDDWPWGRHTLWELIPDSPPVPRLVGLCAARYNTGTRKMTCQMSQRFGSLAHCFN